MKIVAKKQHQCDCCRITIKAGEECFIYLGYPAVANQEFTVTYECKSCTERQVCRKEKVAA